VSPGGGLACAIARVQQAKLAHRVFILILTFASPAFEQQQKQQRKRGLKFIVLILI
jgi:hypothetical protein